MATKPDKRSQDEPETQDETPPGPARRIPWATILVVSGVLLMEAVTVVLVMWLNAGPAKVSAAPGVQADGSIVQNEQVEELIVEGKAINTKRGVTYVYRYKIHGCVDKDDLAAVKVVLDRRRATIEDAVRRVVARLEPRDLDEEPDLTALRRALNQEFEQIFGPNKLQKLLVSEWTRLRADY